MRNERTLPAVACILVFAVFYLTVFGDLCVVDDFGNIMEWANGHGMTLKQIFLPRCAGGGYYRPLVGLSYLVNLRIWDLDSRVLHLENVLLHSANVLLVYWLTRSLLPRESRQGSLLPLAASLLFGLHPITTESVDWISGRTDLMAGFFVLLSALLLLRYRESRSSLTLCASLAALGVGMLGKEVALAFLPGMFLLRPDMGRDPGAALQREPVRELLAFLILAGLTVVVEVGFFEFRVLLLTAPLYALFLHRSRRVGSGRAALVTVAAAGVALLAAAGIFFAVRRIVFTSSIERVPQTLKLMAQDPNHTLSIFLGGIGFYVKKFLMPLPLNFAIREIDPLYAVAGTFLVFGCLALSARRTLPGTLVLIGGLFFLPVLPLALGTVAWTAYAERYIYISSAFWTVALVLRGAPLLAPWPRASRVAVVGLVCLCAVVAVQRNLIWHNSLTLMADTVAKSPRFKLARTIYMSELVKVGDLKGAVEQYRIASAIPSIFYDEQLDALMAGIYLRQGQEEKALELYDTIFRKTKGHSQLARRQLEVLLKDRISKEKRLEVRESLLARLELYQRHVDTRAVSGAALAGH